VRDIVVNGDCGAVLVLLWVVVLVKVYGGFEAVLSGAWMDGGVKLMASMSLQCLADVDNQLLIIHVEI